jgi:hypothetical protein
VSTFETVDLRPARERQGASNLIVEGMSSD